MKAEWFDFFVTLCIFTKETGLKIQIPMLGKNSKIGFNGHQMMKF